MSTSLQHAVEARQVDIHTRDGDIDSWVFQPEGEGRWPLAVLNTDIKGVRETFVEHGRRLASYGFFVVLPNLYFHATTTYNILRHNGVEIGKLDFLGKI